MGLFVTASQPVPSWPLIPTTEMEWKVRIIGHNKALRTETTMKSTLTCLNKYTGIHDYKTNKVISEPEAAGRFSQEPSAQISSLSSPPNPDGGGGWDTLYPHTNLWGKKLRRGENSRNQWWCITDLLDCRGQVQAQLNDFVLCHREIRDPCEWSPRKEQNSLYWGADDGERNPWASHHRCWHTWLYYRLAYLSWCYFFSTHNIKRSDPENQLIYYKGPYTLPREKSNQ